MKLEIPPLPYEKNALEPYISADTLHYHYDKHHQGYMDKLKKAIDGTPLVQQSLEEIICATDDPKVFNPAAQVWNHTFYWQSMHPKGGGQPPGQLSKTLEANFGSVDGFKEKFKQAALNQFGSGWAWLVQDANGRLDILATPNAANPMCQGSIPLLTIDVWEHAYYLDYQNRRNDYVDAFLEHLLHWDFIDKNLQNRPGTRAA